MAQLTPQIINAVYSSSGATGLLPTYAAATAGGDSLAAGPTTFLHVKNGAGAPITVTLAVQAQQEGHPEVAETMTVANASEKMIGPLPTRIYGDANGNVQVTYSSATTVTVAALVLAA